MCEVRFPGRIALYWAPSWILLLPFGLIEGCGNWQSFTISQHWWRFGGSPSPSSFFLNFFFQMDESVIFFSVVHVNINIFECISLYMCACCHAHTHAHLNASVGNCFNGIRGDYGSCWKNGTVGLTWENTHKHTHVALIALKATLLVILWWHSISQKLSQGCK